jgi:hypothetical protein
LVLLKMRLSRTSSRSLLFLVLLDQCQSCHELCPEDLAEVNQAGQDLELGSLWYLTSLSPILCVELVQIVYQCVLLAQCDGIVKEASADDLHHPLDLQACKPDPALPESPEDSSMADLDSCTRTASALHPG